MFTRLSWGFTRNDKVAITVVRMACGAARQDRMLCWGHVAEANGDLSVPAALQQLDGRIVVL